MSQQPHVRAPRRAPRHRTAIRRGDIATIDDRRLHGIVGRMLNQRDLADLTERQEWLLERVFDELEKRWHATPAGQRCSCEWCVPRDFLLPD